MIVEFEIHFLFVGRLVEDERRGRMGRKRGRARKEGIKSLGQDSRESSSRDQWRRDGDVNSPVSLGSC